MSKDEFYGRSINKGFTSLEFNMCEVCQRRSPNWMEAIFEEDNPVIRFTCDECHNEFLESDLEDVSAELFSREVNDEDLDEEDRPTWVNEIIKEQSEAGTIEKIDTTKAASADEDTFSKPTGSFSGSQPESEEEFTYDSDKQVAVWAPKFIQEALFGSDPNSWLEDKGAFEEENIPMTIKTLRNFSNNEMTNVKLSAIRGLKEIAQRYPNSQSDVKSAIKQFKSDDDDIVIQFANDNFESI